MGPYRAALLLYPWPRVGSSRSGAGPGHRGGPTGLVVLWILAQNNVDLFVVFRRKVKRRVRVVVWSVAVFVELVGRKRRRCADIASRHRTLTNVRRGKAKKTLGKHNVDLFRVAVSRFPW